MDVTSVNKMLIQGNSPLQFVTKERNGLENVQGEANERYCVRWKIKLARTSEHLVAVLDVTLTSR